MPTLSHRRRRLLSTVGKLAGAVAISGALVAGMVLPFVGGAGVVANQAANDFLNTACDLVISPAQQTSTVYASDGTTVIATLYAQNRKDIPLSQIPQPVQDALISTEDKRFYSHHGVDLRGLIRAAVANSDGSGNTQGGSTLTMQYVKQVRYYQASTDAQRQAAIQQDLTRKIQDAKCAIDLEKRYSKSQILDDYLNIAFFGENSYGIEVAAQTYFGIPASKLTVPQAAMLVGLVQSPSELDPFVNPSAAQARRNQVLQNMVANNELSAAAATKYSASPLGLSSSKAPAAGQGCTNASTAVKNAGFFCDYALAWLEKTGGLKAQVLQTGGLKIVTSLDASLQNSGQQAIWNSGLDPTSPTALVMPSVDPRTGAVQTMITSRHYGVGAGQTTLPLFTAGYAGSGSTYKYFTTLTALKLGVQPDFTLTTGSNAYTVKNCPTDANTVPYQTHNAGTYQPTLPLSSALPESVNTYFVGMEDQLFGCDLSPIVQTALDLGMDTLKQPDHAGSTETIAQATIAEHRSSFTLGFAPTSALELSAAYGAVANDGVFCPANPILSVTGPTGAPVHYTKPSCSRQFDTQVARTMVTMMTADTKSYLGTAGEYFRNWYAAGGSPVASKTGTDNDDANGPDGGNGNSALWYAGITPTLVSAAALVNPTSPKATVTGLPQSVSNNGSDVFGAYAATFWLDAYGPGLAQQTWSWADPNDVPSPVQVPNLAGNSPADATSTLTALGLGTTVSLTVCGSGEPAGTVGYYEPHLATAGSKVTLCLSNGTAPTGSNQYGGGYYYGGGNTGTGRTSSSPGGTPSTGAGGTGTGGTGTGGVSAPPSGTPIKRHPG
ncbi:MAG: penicillin-binding protein [Actinomycetota bacterium]|nr:penicillin-binding protein [Actinomycetota bacterium]MDQ2955484.1 penicillin-binding protein [Actinomycetota bacterium]